jgi:hypothetical protein
VVSGATDEAGVAGAVVGGVVVASTTVVVVSSTMVVVGASVVVVVGGSVEVVVEDGAVTLTGEVEELTTAVVVVAVCVATRSSAPEPVVAKMAARTTLSRMIAVPPPTKRLWRVDMFDPNACRSGG